MELRHLRYFIAVAEEENVSRAALKLHVSQPGLSRQIHDLEHEIGFPLFARTAKSLKLTAAGKNFLAGARTVLAQVATAVQQAHAIHGQMQGEIHVGYAPSLTVQILPVALRKFQAQSPRTRVALHDLSSEEMLTQLRAGKLQVALTVRPPRAMLRGLEFAELARYALCVAVTPKHPLAKSKSLALAQVAPEPLIGYSAGEYPEYHASLKKLFAPLGRRPQLAEEHDGVTSLITAVESGRGFALVPSCFACMAGPRLKIIPLQPAGPMIPVAAVWDQRKISATVEKFIAAAGAR
jgi:DNA-binding transcriptional LysR family regulator